MTHENGTNTRYPSPAHRNNYYILIIILVVANDIDIVTDVRRRWRYIELLNILSKVIWVWSLRFCEFKNIWSPAMNDEIWFGDNIIEFGLLETIQKNITRNKNYDIDKEIALRLLLSILIYITNSYEVWIIVVVFIIYTKLFMMILWYRVIYDIEKILIGRYIIKNIWTVYYIVGHYLYNN